MKSVKRAEIARRDGVIAGQAGEDAAGPSLSQWSPLAAGRSPRGAAGRRPAATAASWRAGRSRVTGLLLATVSALWLLSGAGCSLQNLKESNRRLKESNDRLITENNRLVEENAALLRRAEDSRALAAVEPVPTAAVARDPGAAAKASAKDDLLLLDDDDVEVTKTQSGIRLRVPDRVFFALGQSTLSQRGQAVLDKVAKVIRGYPGHMVRVDGHTDDTPIRKIRNLYPTNWELSTARACTVVRYLVDRGKVDSSRIFPAGFSHYRPVSTGRTASEKSQNRRVEITILNDANNV